MSKIAFVAATSLVIHGLMTLVWVTPDPQPVAPNHDNRMCHNTEQPLNEDHIVHQPQLKVPNRPVTQPQTALASQTTPFAAASSTQLVSQTLASLKAELNKRLHSTEEPHALLTLTEQAVLLKQPELLFAHTNKILHQSQSLDALQQEDLLILLENRLQPEHLEALTPYLTSQYEDVQEEALLRLLEINAAPQIEQHLRYLANYGLTLWVREEAEKQLDMLNARIPLKAYLSE
ncbi:MULTISPECIES: hypothetical protein [unclassified Pseudoalteromonas]|uniref:hypothetical protein n=1 Tax=unclassified Pseudoalteromonas TaxID=194690 RepID=UPI0020981637|nr:hypothetical protein [Pseudoalteromonas sp. XMcav2-N]MCO7189988.1 hypothetical protein [Pseudoalteromonas sp. XMcav2-N]